MQEHGKRYSSAELRRWWRYHWDARNRYLSELEAWRAAAHQFEAHLLPPQPDEPIMPAFLRGLTCGAKTRKGTPCQRRDLHRSGRCRLHGGLSTGPKTEAGKRWSARSGNCPKRRKRTP